MPPTNTDRRLKELLTALGCPDDIAPWPWGTPLFAERTGELIAPSTIRRFASPQAALDSLTRWKAPGTHPHHPRRRAAR